MTRGQLEGPAIPRTVRDETPERGGVSPPVLGRKPSSEEPRGLELAQVLVRISKLARRASEGWTFDQYELARASG